MLYYGFAIYPFFAPKSNKCEDRNQHGTCRPTMQVKLLSPAYLAYFWLLLGLLFIYCNNYIFVISNLDIFKILNPAFCVPQNVCIHHKLYFCPHSIFHPYNVSKRTHRSQHIKKEQTNYRRETLNFIITLFQCVLLYIIFHNLQVYT